METLHDVNSAARILSISPWTVRAFCKSGKIRPVRIGRRVLIEARELERLVTEGRQNPKAGKEIQHA